MRDCNSTQLEDLAEKLEGLWVPKGTDGSPGVQANRALGPKSQDFNVQHSCQVRMT